MSFVLAQQQGWPSDSLTTVPLGPFGALRTGVTDASAEFFMWEHFTTKPYFHATAENPAPPLKNIGEIYTPWPSWMIVASTAVFPDPAADARLEKLLAALDQGVRDFEADTAQAVRLLGTGELGCTYGEEDATEWLKDVRFVKGTRGVSREIVEGVVDVLKVAGVIDQGMGHDEAVKRVVGIAR